MSPHSESTHANGDQGTRKHPPGLAVCMADVEAEEVQWLWHPYIAFGKLTSIEGDPDVGKSWLTMALAAQVSRGAKLPGASKTGAPETVLFPSALKLMLNYLKSG